jgi:hypothetical protein
MTAAAPSAAAGRGADQDGSQRDAILQGGESREALTGGRYQISRGKFVRGGLSPKNDDPGENGI